MTSFSKINDLLQQEVSRTEFLRFTGIALLGLFGITSLLNNLHTASTVSQQTKRNAGYGMSAYGR